MTRTLIRAGAVLALAMSANVAAFAGADDYVFEPVSAEVRKGDVTVSVRLKHDKIHAEDCAECETKSGMLDRIDLVIATEGALDADQRKRLMEIAEKCPVHRTLTSEIRIVTRAAD